MSVDKIIDYCIIVKKLNKKSSTISKYNSKIQRRNELFCSLSVFDASILYMSAQTTKPTGVTQKRFIGDFQKLTIFTNYILYIIMSIKIIACYI